ncbi:hypothetical protein BpHYR1_040505, partial [Brachionus plicatilis]
NWIIKITLVVVSKEIRVYFRSNLVSNLNIEKCLVMHIGSKNIYETRGTFDANNLIEHYSQLSHERDILQPEDLHKNDKLDKTLWNILIDRIKYSTKKILQKRVKTDSWESESEEEFLDSDCTINENINVENLDQTKQIVHNMSEKSDPETKDQKNRILRKRKYQLDITEK